MWTNNSILSGRIHHNFHLSCVLLYWILLTPSSLLNAQAEPGDYERENMWQETLEELELVTCENLLKGEILVEKIRDSDGMPGIRAIFTISASREEIWGMLTDYENFSNIYGGIDSVLILNENEDGAWVKIFQDIRIKKIQFTLERRYLNPGHRLEWCRVSGDLKVVKGSWDILESPEDELNLVVYTSYFKYGGIIPTRLSRNWAMDEVRNMALSARLWIRDNPQLYSKY